MSKRPIADMAALPDVDRGLFLLAMRAVPGAVAIVATGMVGDRRGLAATAWCSLTADPPTILVCVNQSASAHDPILDTAAFSLNLVPHGHVEMVATFSGQRGRDGEARFAGDDRWSTGPSGLPMLDGVIAAFECSVDHAYRHGTHTILIGRITYLLANGEGDALMYVGGGFARAAMLG